MSRTGHSADEITLPIKRTDGETLADRLTDNAYHNILPARYLRKDADGNHTETQEELFARISRNIALAEAVYESERRGVELTVRPDQLKPNHPRRDELAAEVFGEGTTTKDDVETALTERNVNKFEWETVVPELPEDIREHVEAVEAEFRELMESLSFVPNSPTLMNAGDELQQLSACFVDSPTDDIVDIHQTAKEAAQVFQCLTADSTVVTKDRGIVSVAAVLEGDRVLQQSEEGFRYQPVDAVHQYEAAPTLTVELANGLSLRGTPNHRLKVDGEWSRLDEIRPGQRVHYGLGWIRDADPAVPRLERVPSGPRWGDNRGVSNDEILRLHGQGPSDYEVADRLECGKSAVQRRRTEKLALPPNGTGGRRPGSTSFDEPTGLALHREGNTDSAIAAELGVSPSSIGRFRTRNNLQPNGTPVNSVDLPGRLTEELAELVGLWIGDGSWYEDGVRFHVGRESIADYIDHLVERLFGITPSSTYAEGCYEVCINSHEIKRWWAANFDCKVDGARSATVPDVVTRAPAEVIQAFLRGLFTADGTLLKDTYPKLYSSSERLIDDAATLMLGLGYPIKKTVIRDDESNPYYGLTPTTGQARHAFLREVGFIDERREVGLESIREVVPLDSYTIGDAYMVEVESVSESGTATVYDLTVADHHEYITDGIVSHNSGGGMGYAFWRLRPFGDPVGSTGGIASGPLTFMETYDQLCFVPGTSVLTPSGTVPIEQIDPGQSVIDENGDEQVVTDTMTRFIDEDIVEVVPERINNPIKATCEHPFKVAREDGFEWVDAEDLKPGDEIVLGCAADDNGLQLDDAIDLTTIASGPLVFTDGGITVNREYYNTRKGAAPRRIETDVPVEDFTTIAGWYLAEGCVTFQRGIPSIVSFTLNSAEREAAGEIKEALLSFGVTTRVVVIEERSTLNVYVEDSSFAQLIHGLFGTGAAEKRVPQILWKAPPEVQANVLEALFAGDGRLQRRGQSQRVQLKLANQHIIDFVCQVGLRCGAQFSRHNRNPDGRLPTASASLSISTAIGTPLECLFDDVPDDFRPHELTRQAHGREVVRVKSVDSVHYEGPVHNLEVAETNTYIAEDLVVHNCETIAQGGTRRGAQMAIMRVSHPDVVEFIHAKNKDVSLAHSLKLNDPDDYTYTTFSEALEEARGLIDEEGRVPKHLRNAVEGHLSNFNISVGVTDDFMAALKNDEDYTFINPRTGEPHVATEHTAEMYSRYGLGDYVTPGEVLSLPASVLWDRIVRGAHQNGEPGVIYLDRVNDEHSFPVESTPTGDGSKYEILATNPCVTGETLIATADGRGGVPIETLAAEGKDVPVYCLDEETGEVEVRTGRDPRLTRRNAELIRVRTDGDVSLRCTPDHEIPTRNRGVVAAGSLEPGDSLYVLPRAMSDAGTDPVEAPTGNHVVTGVEPDGRGDVYNLTVDEHHNFYAGIGVEDDVYVNVSNCGEQPLMEYEACNLGHINLSTIAAIDAPDWRVWSAEHGDDHDSLEAAVSAFLDEAIDGEEFDHRIEWGTRFLENVVTMSDFPVDRIEETVRRNRKIGLGIMGLAQLYVQLGVRYGSDVGNEVARQLMVRINHGSKWTSHELAGERGSFANWADSKYADPPAYREWFEHQTGLDADEWADGFPIRNHNSTTIAPTGCVEESTLVSTDRGLQKISDMGESDAINRWDSIDRTVMTDEGERSATAFYDNGFDAVKTIETETGFSVTATLDHKFRVITEDNEYLWRKARNIKPGDSVVLKRGSFVGRSDPCQLDVSERENIHYRRDPQLELPARMSEELAILLGFYMGDGHLNSGNGIELAVDSKYSETVEQLISLGEQVFGVTATTEEKSNSTLVSIGGVHTTRFFKDNGWEKKSQTAFVPNEVLQSGEACARAFLQGLFEADGSASRKVEFNTSSETLSKQVQTLLLSLGCVFKREEKSESATGYNTGDETYYVLRGLNKSQDKWFLDEIGFITKSTDISLKESSYRKDKYPPNSVELVRQTTGYYENCERGLKAKVNDAKRRSGLTHNLLSKVERKTTQVVEIAGRELSSLFVDTAKSIEDEVAYTADISVPSNNTYLANGFVTHNTTSMVGNTTGGCEPIYNVAYYKNVSDDVQGDEMLVEFDDYFLRVLEANEVDVETVKAEALDQMRNNRFDGVAGLESVPDGIGELFVVSGDITAEEHAAVQCACQAGVDSAISKTVNAPPDSTMADAKAVFEYIYDHGGKGVTYYRDGTRSKQVLTTRADNAEFADMDADEAAEALLDRIEDVFGGLEGFLEHEGVQEAVAADVEALVERATYGKAKKRPRPDVLTGVTQRIETGYGKLYVNINEDAEGRPFELFANIGNSGGFTASFTEALAKTISTALRSGVDPEEIASELQGIRSPKVAWDKGEQIQSIPDAIGTAMRRYLEGDLPKAYPQQQNLDEIAGRDAEADVGTEPDPGAGPDPEPDGGATVDRRAADQQAIIDAGESPECPTCGSMSLYFSEGCKTCEACGWSEC